MVPMMLFAEHDFSIKNTPLPPWMRPPLAGQPTDPGWLYILKHGDRFKIGRTNAPGRRVREARTWRPDGKVIGIKAFWYVHEFERTLLCGIANFWKEGEWHCFPDESWSDVLVEGFQMFDDHDRNRNTVD